jgi:hypothetical protein
MELWHAWLFIGSSAEGDELVQSRSDCLAVSLHPGSLRALTLLEILFGCLYVGYAVWLS